MKKRGTFFIFPMIFLLALTPNVFSIYEVPIYSGTVEDRDRINISSSLFEFRIDPVSSKVYIEVDVSGVIIASGECKTKGNFDICIGNVSFSYRNYTAYYDVYKAIINVYQIKSRISITNAIGKSSLLIDEETTAELAVENTADVVAKDVTATINIPSPVLVTELDGCKKAFDAIIFNEDVYPRQIKKCTYKIKGLAGGNFELAPNITYFDGIEKKSAASSAISGKVYNYSLRITSKLNKSNVNILEKLNLTFDIENINDQYDLSIPILTVKVPEKLLLLKKPKDTTGNDRIISWSGTLAPKEKKSFAAEFQGIVTGNYSVSIEASYKISKFSRTAENTANIGVYCDCPYISHDFSQQIAVPDQRVTLKALITNPSPVNYFKNVKMNYNTDIPNIQDFSTAYSKINPLEAIKIFDSPITTPHINESYYLNITLVYESSASQFFVVKDNIIIRTPGWEEKIPSVEKEAKIEEQQEAKEQEESEKQQKAQEAGLGAEKTAEETEETAEKGAGEEETPVTIMEIRQKEPAKTLTIMAYIAGAAFILAVLVIFKRKRSKKAKEQKDAMKLSDAGEKKQIIKEALSGIFSRIKEGIKRKPKGYKKEESGYRDLEKEIRQLGKSLEDEKQRDKMGLFGRIFRRK